MTLFFFYYYAKDSLYSLSNTKNQTKVGVSFQINHDPNNKDLYKNVTFTHNGPLLQQIPILILFIQ